MGDNYGKAALAISIPTAIGSLAALMNSNAKKASASEPGNVASTVTLDSATLQLLAAMGLAIDDIRSNQGTLIEVLQTLAGTLGNLQLGNVTLNGFGYPPNAPKIQAIRFQLTNAGQGYQLPDMAVPDGMMLTVKAWPTNPVGSLVYLADSQPNSSNANFVYPLMPNEAMQYQVQNANQIYVSGTVGGIWVVISCERRS